MKVDDAGDPADFIRNQQRRDLAFLHERQGTSGQFLSVDGDGVSGHAVHRLLPENQLVFFQLAPQVPVGNDSHQASPLIDDAGNAKAFARHLVYHVPHQGGRSHQGKPLPTAHQILDPAQLEPELSAGMKDREIFGSEAFLLQNRHGQRVPPSSEMRGTLRRFQLSRSCRSSSVSPLLETAITTSSFTTMPRSPCSASAGCRKREGVPVLFKVAAIFRQMIPDLPMPVTTTRPRHLDTSSTARENLSSRRWMRFSMARASLATTRSALSRLNQPSPAGT